MDRHEIGVVDALRLILVFSAAALLIPLTIMVAQFLLMVLVGVVSRFWKFFAGLARRVSPK